jgi:hypothetical protein
LLERLVHFTAAWRIFRFTISSSSCPSSITAALRLFHFTAAFRGLCLERSRDLLEAALMLHLQQVSFVI